MHRDLQRNLPYPNQFKRLNDTDINKLPYELVLWHAYVIKCVFKITPPFLDNYTHNRVRFYLLDSGVVYPWHVYDIFYLLYRSKARALHKEIKKLFPEVFKRSSKQKPVKIPDKLLKITAASDIMITSLEEEFKEERKKKMNTNNDNNNSSNNPQSSGSATAKIDLDNLTVENYKQIVGKRFRQTKAEKQAGISREEALAIRIQKGEY